MADGVRFLIAFPRRISIFSITLEVKRTSIPRLRVITGEKDVRFRGYKIYKRDLDQSYVQIEVFTGAFFDRSSFSSPFSASFL